ncbi:MAG: hypothetical protein WHS44_11915 [Fimbriimonadales bacterium]|nr:MAG: hypothetical protein KatS3mg018_2360 [Fimbriimonadales bacterium]
MRLALMVWGLVLLMVCAHAQSVAWSRLYLHPNARGLLPQVAAADSQGNLIVAGRYFHPTDPFNSVAIVKYAPNGDLLWTRTFGESGQADYAEAIAVAPDGSFYLGITRANSNSVAYLQRWSANGDMLWSATIDLNTYDVIRQILVRPDGGAEVLHTQGSGGIGYARLRYDTSGNRLLNNTFWQPSTLLANRTPVGMLLLDTNTTLIAYVDGEVGEIIRGYARTYLRAIDNAGNSVYTASYPLRTERLARADDGSLYLLGDYWHAPSQQMRLRLCRVNPTSGALLGQWELSAAAGDAIPDVFAVSGGVWLATGAWETSSTRGFSTMLGTASGASLGTATLEGVYRPVAGVRTATGALAQLIGERLPSPDRWKPALQWFRSDGALMAQGYLPELSPADETPELLVASPDGALYVVATVQQGSQNIAGAGIWRIDPPPTLSGQVALNDYLPSPAGKTAQFTLTNGSQTDAATVTLGAGGGYTLQTGVTGTVQARVYVPGWLGQRQTLTVGSSGVITANWSLINGDANRDNQIDDADLLVVLFAFGGNDPTADLNGDGAVDDADLLIVLFNFGTIGE